MTLEASLVAFANARSRKLEGMALRHAWLQKHPSPVASQGEFHWYPADDDRELRGALVERLSGAEPPAVLWQLEPGRVIWAQLFGAVAPAASDSRRYTGMAVTIAEHANTATADLLDTLALPACGPWMPGVAATPPSKGTTPSLDLTETLAVARALLSGGEAHVRDPACSALPRLVAAIEHWLPERTVRRTRIGAWSASHGVEARPSVDPDPVALLLARACRGEGSRGWRMICELAGARGEEVDQVAAAARTDSLRAALVDAERTMIAPLLVPGCDSLDILHAWGRGQLDHSPAAHSLPDRLADAIALRAIARALDDRDPATAIFEARWHALLPAVRRRQLVDLVSMLVPTLAAKVANAIEGDDG